MLSFTLAIHWPPFFPFFSFLEDIFFHPSTFSNLKLKTLFEPHQKKTITFSHTDDIKDTISQFLFQCHIPFCITPYDHEFHQACCDVAVVNNYPMETSPGLPSLLPFIPGGVVMATTAYAHLSSRPTRIFIALYTAFLIYLDDAFERDTEGVSAFNERFIRQQAQGNPMLDAFAALLSEMPRRFGRLESNIMITSTLNLVSALLLERETMGMSLSPNADGYATFSRVMSGASETYALFIFPPEAPLTVYVQALPELMKFINNGNDILSFYKEDLAGDSVNRVSILAQCNGVSKIDILRELAEAAVTSNAKLSEILSQHPVTHHSYAKFSHGYIGFHASLRRYRLTEIL